MEQTTLSKYVKAMRKQYNLTQVELSEKSGVGLRLHTICSQPHWLCQKIPKSWHLPLTARNVKSKRHLYNMRLESGIRRTSNATQIYAELVMSCRCPLLCFSIIAKMI